MVEIGYTYFHKFDPVNVGYLGNNLFKMKNSLSSKRFSVDVKNCMVNLLDDMSFTYVLFLWINDVSKIEQISS